MDDARLNIGCNAPDVGSTCSWRASMDSSSWVRFFCFGWGSGFSAYVVLQFITTLTLKRLPRYLSLVPVPFMIWVVFVTAHAWQQQSNMWPITLIFASPIAVLYLLA